jgi:hypothetical protein
MLALVNGWLAAKQTIRISVLGGRLLELSPADRHRSSTIPGCSSQPAAPCHGIRNLYQSTRKCSQIHIYVSG